MSVQLPNPQQEIDKIVSFLQSTYQQHQKNAVIAVSGGIDSALALSLLARALPPQQITTVLLPYHQQSMEDATYICDWNKIPANQQKTINIGAVVDQIAEQVSLPIQSTDPTEKIRLGNIMVRTRMIVTFDFAKKNNALVCGTENKSEHYLGYFTRFGDAASDVEPIEHLYKTQVRQLASFLQLPQQFLEKAPSAGLWDNQTDESQLGFSYEHADLVIQQLVDNKTPAEQIAQTLPHISPEIIQKIIAHIQSQAFKHHVPYIMK